MKLCLCGILGLALSLPASAITLDFSGTACGQVCSNTDEISQDYGDIAGVLDLTYDGDPTASGSQPLFWWGQGYSGLDGVAFSQGRRLGLAMLFDALPGYGVAMTGFDIASYLGRATTTRIRITDVGSGTLLYDSGIFAPDRNAPTRFAGDYRSDAGLLLELGPDAWSLGIDNITLTTYPVGTGPAPIPLPASALLLLSALGAIGAIGRRGRRSAIAV